MQFENESSTEIDFRNDLRLTEHTRMYPIRKQIGGHRQSDSFGRRPINANSFYG